MVLVLAATAQDPPDPPDPSDPLHPERVHQFSVATSPFDFFDKTQALPVYYTPGNQDQLIDPPGQNIQMESKLIFNTQIKYLRSTVFLLLPVPFVYHPLEGTSDR